MIPKPDGRERPLAVAALEDRVVQKATVAVLNVIYEEEFPGFSYGFRPKRGPHDALDALIVGISRRKVNFILDADIPVCRSEASKIRHDKPDLRPFGLQAGGSDRFSIQSVNHGWFVSWHIGSAIDASSA